MYTVERDRIYIFQKIEDPLRKLDSVLCLGLDFVEKYVPAVKLTSSEVWYHTPLNL